ncbi:limonene-1,2-epoxide hydrolase (plasmid) [Novosphingobium sp. THN1]|nr:limonene-1,2-epoxide hydrolase [Novosphingobium sp. THN1]
MRRVKGSGQKRRGEVDLADDTDMSPLECVLSFCSAWTGPDLDRVIAHLAPDITYHNIPMEPLSGLAAVERYLRGVGPLTDSAWEVRHAAANGDHVLTERIDRMTIGGARVELPLMGVFRVRDNLICEWRDYFDLASYRAQMAALGTPKGH